MHITQTVKAVLKCYIKTTSWGRKYELKLNTQSLKLEILQPQTLKYVWENPLARKGLWSLDHINNILVM